MSFNSMLIPLSGVARGNGAKPVPRPFARMMIDLTRQKVVEELNPVIRQQTSSIPPRNWKELKAYCEHINVDLPRFITINLPSFPSESADFLCNYYAEGVDTEGLTMDDLVSF